MIFLPEFVELCCVKCLKLGYLNKTENTCISRMSLVLKLFSADHTQDNRVDMNII